MIGPIRNCYVVNLPFCGFYESTLSHSLDWEEERFIEDEASCQKDEGIPPELRLTEEQFSDFVSDARNNYRQAELMVAEAYVDRFSEVASERLGYELNLWFESMDSPREYNFGTDRVYAWISEETIRQLMIRSMVDGHQQLIAIIKERFTSGDGFSSSYSNELQDWFDTPLLQWDHNQLGTLLMAVLAIGCDKGEESIEREVTDDLHEGELFYRAFEESIDWPAFDAAVAEKRQELEDEIRQNEDPNYVPAYRCLETPDLFERIAA